MKKQILVVAAAALMTMASVVPAMAQSTGSIEITGGDLGITPQLAVDFADFDYDGKVHDLTNEVALTTPWGVEDLTGSGEGWRVTVSAANFLDGTKVIDASNFKIQLLDAGIDLGDGNPGTGRSALPTTSLSQDSYTALDGAGVTLVTATANTGMGAYTLQPTFTLHVPADTYAGDYTSVVTVAIVSGPS